MQKWEYLSVTVSTEKDVNQAYLTVKEVNGQPNILVTGEGKKYYVELHEFLEEKGREGWEVVGVTPLDISPSGMVMASLLILKRPVL